MLIELILLHHLVHLGLIGLIKLLSQIFIVHMYVVRDVIIHITCSLIYITASVLNQSVSSSIVNDLVQCIVLHRRPHGRLSLLNQLILIMNLSQASKQCFHLRISSKSACPLFMFPHTLYRIGSRLCWSRQSSLENLA